jgi:hypothetical protein
LGGQAVASGFLLLILAIAGCGFIFRASTSRFDRTDSVAWLFFTVACVGIRGVLGRADSGHLALYGVIAAVPAAWLLRRSLQVQSYSVIIRFSLALLFLTRLHPIQTIDIELGAVSAASTNRAQQAADAVRLLPDSRGGIPRAQAQQLTALKAYLDAQLGPQETFFDFSNEPALHFLTNRPMPTRFLGTPFYEPPALQREVIARLESVKPPIAIVAGNGWADSLDDVPNRRRAPLVAQYLDLHYATRLQVSRWTIGLRR